MQSSGDARRTPNEGFSNEELRMIREAKEEYKRRGKFVRIYPTPESWELYGLALLTVFFIFAANVES